MRVALLCVLVVLAGCGAPQFSGGERAPVEGVGPDAAIAVDASDGLNHTELNRTVARAMARLETLRGLEFRERVPVRVINRSQYRENPPGGTEPIHSAWNNQVWEGLLLVGEDRNVTRVFESTLGNAVLGYYSPSADEIVLVSNSDEPRVARGTLVHELVHALQDQQFGLGEAPPTQDRQLARNGVIEGEATLLEARYQRRCGTEWDCVETPPSAVGSGSVDRGLLAVIRYPYTVGPEFVTAIERRGGWGAVDDLYEEYPESTEQVTYPSLYPEERPLEVTVPDRSSEEWRRFDHEPVADTVGQASIHVMLEQNGAISGGGEYTHPITDAWAGDRLVPYRNGQARGYVWELAWESEADAREFREVYLDALERLGGRREGSVTVIPDSSAFGDAFRVTQQGERVRIVNAPTVDALEEVHAPRG